MKVAYLNPWSNSAENQSYHSLRAAAVKLGIELVDCRVGEDVEAANPEFVISVASSIPKVADVTTYLTVHEPKRRFLDSAFYFSNLLTYDGYLTISDNLRSFVRDVCFGAGRAEAPGFYYNAPQLSPFATDLSALVRDDRLRLAYFGTNWDHRLPALFRRLDHSGLLRIHGPTGAWAKDGYRSYAGPLPFDGEAPQRAYAECGLGLVLLSADHLREGIISNRIFEISSVGALPICPSIPWIRQWFGDTVLYFDAHATAGTLARQILQQVGFAKANPGLAQEMALAARAIFESHFAAERLLENVLAYHQDKQRTRRRQLERLRSDQPEISVIVRCGGRPVEMVRIAVDSIRRQTLGRLTVIFAKYRDIDLGSLVSDISGAIVAFTEISVPGGNRGATLAAGLRALGTKYFAILDDDDFWLQDHVESLFAAARIADPEFDMAFSGVICKTEEMVRIERGLEWDRNIRTFGFREQISSVNDIARDIGTNSFVARTAVLGDGLGELPDMDSAEDSLIVAIAARRKRPVFSYRATAVLLRGFVEQSGWERLPNRRDDLLTSQLRSGMLLGPTWIGLSSINSVLRSWRDLPASPKDRATEDHEAFIALGEPMLSDELHEGWDLTDRMQAGRAGRKLPEGGFAAHRFAKGHVCYGPYVGLPAGNYRVEVAIGPLTGVVGALQRVLPVWAGALDVVSVEASWEGAARRFRLSDRKVSAEFLISDELRGQDIEFRIASYGTAAFAIRSVVLWHLGQQPEAPHPISPRGVTVHHSTDPSKATAL